MKISITDSGSGIARELAKAIGATIAGRFINIPEAKGGGYITGFGWGKDLRMMVRNYYLKEEVLIERTNELAEGQDDIVFLMSGIFPSLLPHEKQLTAEQTNILICKHAVSSVMAMPSNTQFGSITIAVSKQYLQNTFGDTDHPVVKSILEAKDNFIFETGISPAMVQIAGEFLQQCVPESMESHFYKLKCEELLCHTFALLVQREAVPTSSMHIDDIKAIYAIRSRLQLRPGKPPDIASLASEAAMSEPKMRKLFKQAFGKGIFEYYQWARMQEAARLLKEKRSTVSEVGYQLGFTNLSHFSRVFEQHWGMKPKKYSAA